MEGAFYTGKYRNFFEEQGYNSEEITSRLEKISKQYFMGQMTKGSIMNQDLIWDTWRTQEIMMCVRKECLYGMMVCVSDE